MINNIKNGIFCDLCCMEFKNKFIYYSVNYKKVDVDKDRTNVISESVMDLDICEVCYEKIRNNVLKSLKKINNIKQQQPKPIVSVDKGPKNA